MIKVPPKNDNVVYIGFKPKAQVETRPHFETPPSMPLPTVEILYEIYETLKLMHRQTSNYINNTGDYSKLPECQALSVSMTLTLIAIEEFEEGDPDDAA